MRLLNRFAGVAAVLAVAATASAASHGGGFGGGGFSGRGNSGGASSVRSSVISRSGGYSGASRYSDRYAGGAAYRGRDFTGARSFSYDRGYHGSDHRGGDYHGYRDHDDHEYREYHHDGGRRGGFDLSLGFGFGGYSDSGYYRRGYYDSVPVYSGYDSGYSYYEPSNSAGYYEAPVVYAAPAPVLVSPPVVCAPVTYYHYPCYAPSRTYFAAPGISVGVGVHYSYRH